MSDFDYAPVLIHGAESLREEGRHNQAAILDEVAAELTAMRQERDELRARVETLEENIKIAICKLSLIACTKSTHDQIADAVGNVLDADQPTATDGLEDNPLTGEGAS
jgi:hypothetical protein